MRRFRPYFAYLKAVRGPIITALLCSILYGVANGAGLPLTGKMVFPKIFGEHAVPLANIQLFLITLWLRMIFILRGVTGYFNSYLIQYAGTRILEAISLDYFRKLQIVPLSFLQKQKPGDLISQGMTDTQALQVAFPSP